MTAVLGDRLDALADEVRRDGLCVIRGVLDVAVVDEWKRAFDALFEQRRNVAGGLAPRDTGRYYTTLPWRAPFADPAVFAHPIVVEVVRRALGSDAFEMLQLAVDVPVLGSEYQELHRDHQPLWGDTFETPLFALAVNIPLVAVDAANGPLEIARGSHRLPKEEALRRIAAGELGLEPVLLERGDIVVRAPLALHRGTPNRTERPRPVAVLGFALSWLRDAKVDMRIPRAIYDTFPRSAQMLLRATVVDDADADGPDTRPETYLEFRY